MSRVARLLEIDCILEILGADKGWHTIGELAKKANLPREETVKILGFLATHGFISLNDDGKRAKSKERINRFLARIRVEEKLSAS